MLFLQAPLLHKQGGHQAHVRRCKEQLTLNEKLAAKGLYASEEDLGCLEESTTLTLVYCLDTAIGHGRHEMN